VQNTADAAANLKSIWYFKLRIGMSLSEIKKSPPFKRKIGLLFKYVETNLFSRISFFKIVPCEIILLCKGK
jgi:hypothetical protein